MTTLVTGASGFLGRCLLELVQAEGGDVVAVDRVIPSQAPAGVVWRQADVTDRTALEDVLNSSDARRVIHLAYLLPPESETRPEDAVRTNCAGSAAVFEACRRAGVERVVWTSSMAVYGPASRYPAGPVDESADPRPTALYGATKVLVERLADSYRNLGLSVVGLRFNLVFGPGRVRGLGAFVAWARDMIEACALERPFRVPAADHEADWIYVRDAARAIRLALDAPAPDKVYNVVGERATGRRVAELLAELRPGWPVELEAGELGEDQRTPVFSGAAAARDLGFQPAYSLEAALADYMEVIRAAQGSSRVGGS